MAEKDAILTLHWDLETYENADFYRLQKVLSAKDKKDRLVDPMELL